MRQSPLTDHEETLLVQARALVPGPPPPPWRAALPFLVDGFVAGSWDSADHIVLITHDGYSVTDPLTGECLVRNRDAGLAFAAVAPDHLSFTIPDSGVRIAIFRIWGGDGNHVTPDG